MSLVTLIHHEIIVLCRYGRIALHGWWRRARHIEKNSSPADKPQQIESHKAPVADDTPQTPSASPTTDSNLLDQLEERFQAKQNAREARQHRFLHEKELAERQLNPLKGTTSSSTSPQQLEFDFNAPAQPVEPPHSAAAPSTTMPQPILTQPYQLPPIELLNTENSLARTDVEEMHQASQSIQNTLDAFSIDADVIGFQRGPRVTLYKIGIARGIKVEAVAHIANDLAMALSATSLRILAPMPGHDYVGVEVPNKQADLVRCGATLSNPDFTDSRGMIPIILGRNIEGKDIVIDLARTPHMLVAGATGSGKSVCLNNILMSLLYRFTPDQLRLILVDPKIVELSVYNKLPHLVVPVITEVELVVKALRWVIHEMQRRYAMLAKVGVRNQESFNHRPPAKESQYDDDGNEIPPTLPFIVVIIDEMADIMLTARQDVETCLARIAQLSRAVGIHCIIATQRPSVNVITGVIKANFPTRIAFQVASQVDSRTIIDGKGAESLLGRGDMLYKAADGLRLQRLQGPMISDAEIEHVVDFCSQQAQTELDFSIIKAVGNNPQPEADNSELDEPEAEHDDDDNGQESLVHAAAEIVVSERKASISYIQRRLKIGYNKAATLVEILEKRHVIGPQVGNAPREILVDSVEELDNLY